MILGSLGREVYPSAAGVETEGQGIWIVNRTKERQQPYKHTIASAQVATGMLTTVDIEAHSVALVCQCDTPCPRKYDEVPGLGAWGNTEGDAMFGEFLLG